MNYIYTKTVNINAHILWTDFIDTKNWHNWQNGLEYATIDGTFSVDNIIKYKRKDSNQIIDITITEIIMNEKFLSFTDSINFPLAKMISGHKIIMINEEESIIELTVETTGILSFFWDWLVVNNIIKHMPTNLDHFIEYVEKKITNK